MTFNVESCIYFKICSAAATNWQVVPYHDKLFLNSNFIISLIPLVPVLRLLVVLTIHSICAFICFFVFEKYKLVIRKKSRTKSCSMRRQRVPKIQNARIKTIGKGKYRTPSCDQNHLINGKFKKAQRRHKKSQTCSTEIADRLWTIDWSNGRFGLTGLQGPNLPTNR